MGAGSHGSHTAAFVAPESPVDVQGFGYQWRVSDSKNSETGNIDLFAFNWVSGDKFITVQQKYFNGNPDGNDWFLQPNSRELFSDYLNKYPPTKV